MFGGWRFDFSVSIKRDPEALDLIKVKDEWFFEKRALRGFCMYLVGGAAIWAALRFSYWLLLSGVFDEADVWVAEWITYRAGLLIHLLLIVGDIVIDLFREPKEEETE